VKLRIPNGTRPEDGHLLKWDEEKLMAVDAGVAVEDLGGGPAGDISELVNGAHTLELMANGTLKAMDGALDIHAGALPDGDGLMIYCWAADGWQVTTAPLYIGGAAITLSAGKMSFFDVYTPIAKPTLTTNDAAGVIEALVALGLVTAAA
jgi:hypothetical protein